MDRVVCLAVGFIIGVLAGMFLLALFVVGEEDKHGKRK